MNRPFPELFRGTGQNGQIMKEDLKNWSRKLHNENPPDIFREETKSYKQILQVSIFLHNFFIFLWFTQAIVFLVLG